VGFRDHLQHTLAIRRGLHPQQGGVSIAGFRILALWFKSLEFMVYGLWFMVYGLWLTVHSLWFMDYGS